MLAEVPDVWEAALDELLALAPLPDPGFGSLLWQAVLGAWPEPTPTCATGCTATPRRRCARPATAPRGPRRTRPTRRPCTPPSTRPSTTPRCGGVLDEPARPRRGARLEQRAGRQAGRAHDARRARRLPGQRAVGAEPGRPRQPAPGRLRPRAGLPALRRATDRDDDAGAAKLHVTRAALTLRRDRPELFTSYAPVAADRRGGRPRARLRPRRRDHGRHPAAGRAWPPPAAGATPRSTLPAGQLARRAHRQRASPSAALAGRPARRPTRSRCSSGRTDSDARTASTSGRPRPSRRAPARASATSVEMRRGDGRLVVARRHGPGRRTARSTTATCVDDAETPRARPPVAAPARRRARAVPHLRRRRATTWTDARLDRPAARRRGDLRAAHRHLHPRGHVRRRARQARPPARRSASTSSR